MKKKKKVHLIKMQSINSKVVESSIKTSLKKGSGNTKKMGLRMRDITPLPSLHFHRRDGRCQVALRVYCMTSWSSILFRVDKSVP